MKEVFIDWKPDCWNKY